MRSLFAALLLTISAGVVAAPRIAFLIPTGPENLFWKQVSDFMQVVADDLDMQLELYHSSGRMETLRQAMALAETAEPPDYVVFMPHRSTIKVLLEQLEQAQIYSIAINSALPSEEADTIGAPRVNFSHWLGHIYPDDVSAGYAQAKALFEHASQFRPFSKEQPMQLVAMSGGRDSEVAFERNEGLNRFLIDYPQVHLQQLVFTNWSGEVSRKQVPQLLARYPEVDAFWNASDEVALGTLAGLNDHAASLTQQVYISGIDWSPDAVGAIELGKMALSMGQHFLEGGKALLLIYDHFHGIDFAKREGRVIRTGFLELTQQGVTRYRRASTPASLQLIDFTQFSVFHRGEHALPLTMESLYQLSE